MATIPTVAQMRSNPSMYALRDYSPGVSSIVGGGAMSVTINGKRVPLKPEAVRRAKRQRSGA